MNLPRLAPFRLNRPLAAVSAAAIALGGLTACAESADNGSTSTTESTSTATADDAAWPRTIETVDGEGNDTEVTLEAAPERIVSASVTLTGSLLALDAPVVGSGGGQGSSPIFTDEEGFGIQWADIALERDVEPLYQIEPNVEAILAQDPDLVVMSNVGQDSAVAVYEQLAELVPVLVIDYSNQSWQEVTTYLGEATGREDQAAELIAGFEDKVSEAAESITLPPQPVNIISLGREGGMNFFTTESAQGQLFAELGFDILIPAEDLVGTTAQGTDRGDIKGVNPENIAPALAGETVFALNTTGGTPAEETVRTNPALAENTAVAEDRVYGLAPEFFRLDYFSATRLVEYLDEEF
ncbi:Fe2+-enterobactin ABC transporter substrate-binding protein [Corynebacterium sp. YIM 101645]|uniref:Fe2+-enterobactin ABC transporter substrate-binding protein n=1 Tax=Corynebacterium lemuris TaxID=1859292 RepID=A0ABT2FVV9_9CORY|nr:Fe2+-enterobactin ABC transporter substrate-binding protein [Corynebacterium lemuris]MCS5478925.1 Fe2+-enterobactin ABC transporter substrate-binding protein [Corynebacterium lemuris]